MKIIKNYLRALSRSLFLSLAGAIVKPYKQVLILNLHYISKNKDTNIKERAKLYNFIIWLKKNADIILVSDAIKLIDSNAKVDRCTVALTFDDGYDDCLEIGKELAANDIRAVFFVCGNYISSNIEYRKEFNARTREPMKKPLSWEDLNKLRDLGHIIGSHTLDHLDLSQLQLKEARFQIDANIEKLSDYKNSDKYFAWPYGGNEYIKNEILSHAFKVHRYVFSSTKYRINFNDGVYNRRHIEVFWPINHIKYFLSQKRLNNSSKSK